MYCRVSEAATLSRLTLRTTAAPTPEGKADLESQEDTDERVLYA